MTVSTNNRVRLELKFESDWLSPPLEKCKHNPLSATALTYHIRKEKSTETNRREYSCSDTGTSSGNSA